MPEYSSSGPGPTIETGEITDGAVTLAKLDDSLKAFIFAGW